MTIFPCSTFHAAALKTHILFLQTSTVITLDITHIFIITNGCVRKCRQLSFQGSFLITVPKVCAELCKRAFTEDSNAASFAGNILEWDLKLQKLDFLCEFKSLVQNVDILL